MEFDREPTKVSRIIAIYIRIRYTIKYVLTFRTITHIKYPVFIIGCGHSGTSILLSILGNHSKVYSVPKESYLFFENIRNIQKTLCLWIYQSKSSKKEIILEKTPRHLHCVDSILKIFPHSKFIYITRDCRDTVISFMKRGYQLESACKRWVDDNKIFSKISNNSNFFKVRYEDFVNSSTDCLKSLSSFIDISYEKECLDNLNKRKSFYKKYDDCSSIPNEKSHIERRNFQINQNVIDYSGKWKEPENIEIVQKIMSYPNVLDLMNKIGYL